MAKLSYTYRIASLAAALAAAATVFLHTSGLSDNITTLCLSTWFQYRGAINPPSSVALVRVDEESFRSLGATGMFFPRRIWGDLLKKLGAAGAASVVMDISFRSNWPTAGNDDAILESGLESVPTILGVRGAVILKREHASDSEPLVKPEFAAKSAGLAHMLLGSPDTRVIRFPEPLITKERNWDPLFAAGANTVGKKIFPSTDDYLFYYGGPGTIASMSLKDVLRQSPKELAPFFKGRVTFVGYTRDDAGEVGARDKFLTPYPGEMTGVEIHATAAANAIDEKWLMRANSGQIAIALLAFVSAFIVMASTARRSTIVALALTPGWWLAGYAAFREGFIIPGPEIPAVIFPIWILRLAWDQSRQTDILMHLQVAFRCLLPKEFAKKLIAEPDVMEGSRKRDVTVLFSDIEGFTPYSETASDTDLNAFIELYDTALDEAVTEEGGFVIDFAGDGMLALFGAPLSIENPDAAAFRAMEKIRERLSEIAQKGGFPPGAPLKTRFGINAGPARVGMIGAKSRKYYRALGDPVNAGDRIMKLNALLGTTILFPESMVPNLPSSNLAVPVGTFKLKGRESPVALCTILPSEISPRDTDLWKAGLGAFRCQRWNESRAAMQQLASSDGILGKAALFYLKQLCESWPPAAGPGVIAG